MLSENVRNAQRIRMTTKQWVLFFVSKLEFFWKGRCFTWTQAPKDDTLQCSLKFTVFQQQCCQARERVSCLRMFKICFVVKRICFQSSISHNFHSLSVFDFINKINAWEKWSPCGNICSQNANKVTFGEMNVDKSFAFGKTGALWTLFSFLWQCKPYLQASCVFSNIFRAWPIFMTTHVPRVCTYCENVLGRDTLGCDLKTCSIYIGHLLFKKKCATHSQFLPLFLTIPL